MRELAAKAEVSVTSLYKILAGFEIPGFVGKRARAALKEAGLL